MDIQRTDRKLFWNEMLSPVRFGFALLSLGMIYMGIANEMAHAIMPGKPLTIIGLTFFAAAVSSAYQNSVRKRFRNRRYQSLWEGCHDRHRRFEEVLKGMRRDQVADLREMPKTIRAVGESLYEALRRADMISDEVMRTEKTFVNQPPSWTASTSDPQSRELYRIADKNIAEYRQQFAGVMAGVQRTEAQSAVYMTTLDTLRMKMIGHRLVGRNPEMPSQDFLEALAEAKSQLRAIDEALEELELGPYPTTISVMPPPMPVSEEERLRQGG